MKQSIRLSDTSATQAFASALSGLLSGGDTILLYGEIGAGKSVFSRAVIQSLMEQSGMIEDVPSPTFTLVQTYQLAGLEVWHADLYRLTHSDELIELGIEEAFEEAICLIEWPDRLGESKPNNGLSIHLTTIDDDQRQMELEWSDPKWDNILQETQKITEQSK